MKEATPNRSTALPDFLATLRRRSWIIAIVLVVTPLTAIAFSKTQQPLYQATSKVLVNRANIVSAITESDPSTIGNDPTRFLTTQSDIARSPTLASRVVNVAGVPGMTVEKFLKDSDVTAASNADLLNISVSSTDRGDAIRLANAYADEFTKFKTDLDTARINDALETLKTRVKTLSDAGVSPSSPSYATLLQYQSQLETVGKLLANNTQVLNRAVSEQIRPRTKRNALLGGLLGVVLAIALAFLADAIDRRVRVEKEIEDTLGLPLLARIPRPGRRLRSADELVMLSEPTSPESEPFRKLRTHIEFVNLEQQARVIMVTSAVGREGKSTTIANLAIAFARSGRRVALVDLDIRRPYLDRFFRFDPVPGITDVVLKHVPLKKAIRSISLAPNLRRAVSRRGSSRAWAEVRRSLPGSLTASRVPHGGRRSHAGCVEEWSHCRERRVQPPPGGADADGRRRVVGNPGIALVIEELRQEFDYVFIDAPPLLAVGDAMTLGGGVDAIIAVSFD